VPAEKEGAEEEKEAAPAAGPVSAEKEGAEEKKDAVDVTPTNCLQCGGSKPADMCYCEACKNEIRHCKACSFPEKLCPVHTEMMEVMVRKMSELMASDAQ
jgi:hypothetical protein